MQQKYCPCCNSSLRRRKKKTNVLRLFIFGNVYKCGVCYTNYLWSNILGKSILVSKGITESEVFPTTEH